MKRLYLMIIIAILLTGCGGKKLSIGDTISTDFIEMEIGEASWKEEIRPTNPEGVYSYYDNTDNEKYFCLKGKFKNISVESAYTDNISAVVTFDGKYRYTMNIFKYDYNGDLEYNIKPLTKAKYVLACSVPDELYNTYKKCEIIIFFDENLKKDVYNANEAKYKYTVYFEK